MNGFVTAGLLPFVCVCVCGCRVGGYGCLCIVPSINFLLVFLLVNSIWSVLLCMHMISTAVQKVLGDSLGRPLGFMRFILCAAAVDSVCLSAESFQC